MPTLRFKRYLRQLTRITYLPFFIILFASFCLIFLFTYQDQFFKQDFPSAEISFKSDEAKSKLFYKNINIKVNEFRDKKANETLYQDEKIELEKKWFKPKKPVEIAINVENISRINDDLSHLRIKGTIDAVWDKQQSFNNLGISNNTPLTDRAKDDFLKDAKLNFTSAEEQRYVKEGSIQESNNSIKATYRFEGNFPLIRDLRKFPFDKAIWEIKLSHPLNAAVFKPELKNLKKNKIPAFINAYKVQETTCLDNKKNNYCSLVAINNDSEIESARTSISVYGNLVRSPTASFHRFILPIVFGIIVLALVDQVITKDKWDIKLTTPPTILLTFIFLQTGYHSQLEQISYLTYLDQIYLIGYLSCVLMLINAIISKGDWFKKRTNRIKRTKYTRNIRISFLFINIVLPFVLYLIF